MGLRINNNVAAVTALRNLAVSDRRQVTSLERLSTGLKINGASDDPSGLVISERLRAQIRSLKQATENATNASNMVATADNALQQTHDLLLSIRESIIFGLNTGGGDRLQMEAEQDSVDRAIEAIDRVAETTRFATRNLLNGASGFSITALSNVTSNIGGTAIAQANGELLNITPFSIRFDRVTSQTSFRVTLAQAASQAAVLPASATTAAGRVTGATVVASNGPAIIRVTGNLGTEEIQLRSGATAIELKNAVNILRGNTGVYMSAYLSGAVTHSMAFFSETFGQNAVVRIERVDSSSGLFRTTKVPADATTVTTLNNPRNFIEDVGVDAEATINGDAMAAEGNRLTVANEFFDGTVELKPYSALGVYSFNIKNSSGLTFQLNSDAAAADQEIVGIPSVRASHLGHDPTTVGGLSVGGYLTSLHAGRENDLFTDPHNALDIVDAAIDKISDTRAFLGAFDHFNLQPAIHQLEVHVENLTASESDLRDLDFAEETANFTRAQILFQAGTSVLAQANLIPQSVLQLLQ